MTDRLGEKIARRMYRLLTKDANQEEPHCEICGNPIKENIMQPDDHGPMHSMCWMAWMNEQ